MRGRACNCVRYGLFLQRPSGEVLIILIMKEKEIVLEAMRKAGEPVNAGKIAELTGLDRKVVDKAMAELKKEGAIVSPVRCKWTPA